MKFLETGAKVTALLAAVLVLSACNGNNPFKGGSNPVKEYPSANEGAPYKPNQTTVVEPPPDNSQDVCVPPMIVSINPDHGSLLMLFTEDEVSTYKVTVTNRAGQDFTIAHEGPEGSSFTQESKDLTGATYNFSWKPGKSRGSRLVTKSLKVVYNYTSQQSQTLCGEASVGIDLIVDKTSLDPVVSFTNLPDSIALGTESAGFQIVIEDPASNQENAPDIKQIGFRNQGSTGRQQVLDASDAVKCDEAGQFVEGTKWLFNCTLKLADIKRIKATSTTDQKASFFVIAESKRNTGKTSIPTTANFVITAVKAGE